MPGSVTVDSARLSSRRRHGGAPGMAESASAGR